jgi:hypothetical protein
LQQLDQQLRRGAGVAQGAVARGIANPEVGADVVEVVAAELRSDPARQPLGTEDRHPQRWQPESVQGVFHEASVEAGVVGHEGGRPRAFEPAAEGAHGGAGRRRVSDHGVVDAREIRDGSGERPRRADQRLESPGGSQARHAHGADLEDRRLRRR